MLLRCLHLEGGGSFAPYGGPHRSGHTQKGLVFPPVDEGIKRWLGPFPCPKEVVCLGP